jgi:hypothetical protein
MQERPFPCSFHCLCFFADQVFVTYHQFCVVSFASWSDVCSLPVLPAPCGGAATIAGREAQPPVTLRQRPWESMAQEGQAPRRRIWPRPCRTSFRTCQFFADRMPIDRNEDIYRVWSELQYAGIPGILRMKFITWRLCGLCPVIQQTRRRLLLGAMELSLEGRDKHDQQEPNPIGG